MINPIRSIELFFIKLVGTRGSLLLILGGIWVIVGIGYITNQRDIFSRPGPGGKLDFLDVPPFAYVLPSLWILGGAVALTVGLLRAKICEDDWGFNGVALPPLLWGFAYWWSWAINIFYDGQFGRESSYIGGLLFFTITLLIVFLSHHVQDHPLGPCFRRRIRDSN